MSELTSDELKEMDIYRLSETNEWQSVIGLINELIDEAKEDCFNAAKGEPVDYERGRGQGLNDLLGHLETKIENGKELLKEQAEPE